MYSNKPDLQTKIEYCTLIQEHLSSGNTSAIFGPVDDSFLPPGDQYLGRSPRNLLDRPNPRKRRRRLLSL